MDEKKLQEIEARFPERRRKRGYDEVTSDDCLPMTDVLALIAEVRRLRREVWCLEAQARSSPIRY